MQGAAFVYEAIVGPTFQLILKEAVKIPAIDRLVNQNEMKRYKQFVLTCLLWVFVMALAYVLQDKAVAAIRLCSAPLL